MITTRVLSTVFLALTSAVVVFTFHRSFMRMTTDGSDEPLRASKRMPRGELRTGGALFSVAEIEGDPAGPRTRDDDPQQGLVGTTETFRNTSLLIAIRDAGYVCTTIVAAAAGADDRAAWRVSCDDAMVYLVVGDGSGEFVVEPIPYFESPVRPIPTEQPAPLNEQPLLR